MKRLLLSLLAGAAFSLLHCPAQAQLSYQATNFTFSGGDPVFPIKDDVTFTNLALTETFQDATTQTISLYDPADPTHTSTTTLDTGVFNLVSNTLAFSDPVHGAISSASLTGAFDLTTLGIQTVFGGPITNVTISPTFSASLPLSAFGTGTTIFAVDATTGVRYGAGTLEGVAVPEPGSLPLLAVGSLGMVSLWRRRK